MPALPSIPAVAKVLLKYTLGGDTNVLNRLFFTFTGAATNALLNTWCGTIGTQWATHMAPTVMPALALEDVEAQDLTSTMGAVGIATPAAGGSLSSTLMDAGTAIVIKFNIASHYRGGHPKIYLPGIGESYLSNAQTLATGPTATLLTNWAAFMAAIISGAPGGLGTVAHCVPHYFSGWHEVTGPTGRPKARSTVVSGTPVTTAITGYSINPLFASQRRRNLQSTL